MSQALVQAAAALPRAASAASRQAAIALMAFLTLVDLFATQALLPTLAAHYRVGAAAMGLAVNASTAGMALAALAVGLAGRRLPRRGGVIAALALLALPTAMLAVAPDLASFATLRFVQGLAMATAFALTLSYLAEACSPREAAAAFAAYVTGNVASNLFGRLFAAALADHFGLAANFGVFAGLNLAGALLATVALRPGMAMPPAAPVAAGRAVSQLWRQPALRAAGGIGFMILFAFIGTFTYVNFVLAAPPLALSPMQLGVVYLVFAPAMLTTPWAGRLVPRLGSRWAFVASLLAALLGLPLLLWPWLPAVLAGLVLVGAGTFFAQAVATGFVGRHAGMHSAAASGLYLACYFSGGLAGTAVVGALFGRFGWPAAVAGIGCALLAALWMSRRLDVPAASPCLH